MRVISASSRPRTRAGGVSHGAIAKQGNSHLRRILVEAAGCYSRPSGVMRSENAAAPEAVRAKAEKCANRPGKRREALRRRGVAANKAKVAVARELAEWMCLVKPEFRNPQLGGYQTQWIYYIMVLPV